MDNQADLLATIKANLKQAIERKIPREQTIKFELDGQKRACCLTKPITYNDLLKSIQALFGPQIISNLENILCIFARDRTLRLPVKNNDDLDKVIEISRVNGTSKLNFLLIPKRDFPSSISDDQTLSSETNENRNDSPPPGVIVEQKPRQNVSTASQIPNSNDGGLFIPEKHEDSNSSGSWSVFSRESSGSETSSKRRAPALSTIRRISAASSVSASSGQSLSSNSSRNSSSSSESFCLQSSPVKNFRSPLTPSNWKIGRPLGQGAFGKVFLCYDVDTGRELAIKQIPIVEINSEKCREVKILECEINVYKQLNHERIVRYYGAARTDDFLQIFMEYMAGGSVREQIQNYGALNESLTRKYTRQILEGLCYLHENRFVHRDIKCANILRDISGNIKLGDFGTSTRLCSITNQNRRDSGTIGTAHWTAPEVIQGSVLGRKVDIWSLGCTIVEMLTTGPPWRHLEPIAAIFHIATCDKPNYELPENASNSAREFIDFCLTKDYHKRPTAEILLEHLFVNEIFSNSNRNFP